MKKFDFEKEKRDLKILEIIRNVLLFIAFFLGVLVFCLESNASPMRDNTVSANVTIKVVKDYIDNKTAQNGASGNVLIDYGDAILNGIDDLKSMLPSEIQAFIGPAAYASPISTSDFVEAYENNDLSYFVATFDLQSSNDLSNLDDYLYKQSDYIINNVQSDIVLIQPRPLSHLGDYGGNLSDSFVRNIIEFYKDDVSKSFPDPIYFYRVASRYYCANLNEIDGLVLYSGNWNYFVSNINYFISNGYFQSGYEMYAKPMKNGSRYNNFDKVSGGDPNVPNPFLITFPVYGSDNGVFVWQAGFFAEDYINSCILVFRNDSAYLKFLNSSSKSIMPYDFSSLYPDIDFSSMDFSDILKAIRDNGVLESNNIQEIYKRLNETISNGIQDIIDSQKTANELLLALLRYYDKNIVKEGENITEILLDINESIKNISSPDEEEISTYLDTIIQDPSLENRLKHIFPFGVFQDIKDLTDLLDEVTIVEPRWDFRLNVGLFEEKYIDYTIDLTTVPEIEIFRSFWFFFILLSFNILCLGIEYKFLCMFMGGGD